MVTNKVQGKTGTKHRKRTQKQQELRIHFNIRVLTKHKAQHLCGVALTPAEKLQMYAHFPINYICFPGSVLLSQICSLNYSGPTADFSHSCLCSASTVSLQLERNINKGRRIYIRIGRATERSKTTIRIQLNPRGAGGKESGERQRSQLLRRKGSKELFHSGRGLNVKNLVCCPFFIVHYGRWSKSGHWAAVAYWQPKHSTHCASMSGVSTEA